MVLDFFNRETYQDLTARMHRLTPEAKPRWGILNPAQMLKHLQLENELALGLYRGKDYSNPWRQWAFKRVITGKMPIPQVFSKLRMIQAIPELDVIKSQQPIGSFTEEKKICLNQFENIIHASRLADLHPAIGKMSYRDWGYFYGWHTDYHLKQFGV